MADPFEQMQRVMNGYRVIQLLRGQEASRIRFTFIDRKESIRRDPKTGNVILARRTLTISPESFEFVARAIHLGRVSVVLTNSFKPGVRATYKIGANELWVPGTLLPKDGGSVLHECTHAYFDLTCTHATANDEEAAAAVVQALYYRMIKLAGGWKSANAVADDLLQNYAANPDAIPAVDHARWDTLRNKIMVAPAYKRGPAGYRGTLLRKEYRHDG